LSESENSHVADHESPTRPQDPPRLRERELLASIVEMVEGVIRDNERRGFVLERQPAEVRHERLDIVDAFGHRGIVQPLEHPLGDVDGNELAHTGRERESEKPRAGAEVDHPIVRPRLGKLDHAVADREESVTRGNLLPRLDALVPAIRITGHIRNPSQNT